MDFNYYTLNFNKDKNDMEDLENFRRLERLLKKKLQSEFKIELKELYKELNIEPDKTNKYP